VQLLVELLRERVGGPASLAHLAGDLSVSAPTVRSWMDLLERLYQASGTRIHPARFPAELPRFFIDFLTDPGDLVVDPFAGSNTTGAVAEEMDRRWLAFEIKREYAEASKLRFEGAAEAIAEANGQPSLLS
jgi:DNA modification methylase